MAGQEHESLAWALPTVPLPSECSHVPGEAQGESEEGEGPHQSEGVRAGWLQGPVQDQETRTGPQADEGLLPAPGLVHEMDSIQV